MTILYHFLLFVDQNNKKEKTFIGVALLCSSCFTVKRQNLEFFYKVLLALEFFWVKLILWDDRFRTDTLGILLSFINRIKRLLALETDRHFEIERISNIEDFK